MHATRPAAVSGSFYPADAAVLQQEVDQLLDQPSTTTAGRPTALVVPHAGYQYSGAIAAAAFRQLRPWCDDIDRVVLIGPAHRVPLVGAALSAAGYFHTPLGDVVVDSRETQALEKLSGFAVRDDAHAHEHCLEVQLPFLQTLLGDFRLVPVVVGQATSQVLRPLLERYWGAPHTLIVLSTDLSHYLTQAQAEHLDQRTCAAIEALDGERIGEEQACGRYPLRALLDVARHHHAHVQTLAMGTSADSGGDLQRVVGYGAWLLSA
ncbi:MAG: AmmeMemoRadiSam system protein B [Alcanivoracaceae bacterium]|nr:AmmeMemoRadiSam system protein B [Alcanivoracaceae bacterium]